VKRKREVESDTNLQCTKEKIVDKLVEGEMARLMKEEEREMEAFIICLFK